VIVSERIARHFDDEVLSCGLTSYAHPLVCAAIIAAIETIRDENLVERAAALGAWLGPRLGDFAQERPYVGDVRGVGLLWAFELCVPGAPREPAPPARMARLATALRARHLHMHKRDNLLYLAPPLVVEHADLEEGLTALGAALDEAFA
jgi:taurine--2-oxoglutarate transaminase